MEGLHRGHVRKPHSAADVMGSGGSSVGPGHLPLQWKRGKKLYENDRISIAGRRRRIWTVLHQLDAGGLAVSKLVRRRLQAVISANPNPARVNWGVAELMTVAPGVDDRLQPALRGCACRGAREGHGLEALRSRAAGLSTAGTALGDLGNAEGEVLDVTTGAARGRGAGWRGGRQPQVRIPPSTIRPP